MSEKMYRCEKRQECKHGDGMCDFSVPHAHLKQDDVECDAHGGVEGAKSVPVETSAEMLVKDVNRLEAKIDEERRAFSAERDDYHYKIKAIENDLTAANAALHDEQTERWKMDRLREDEARAERDGVELRIDSWRNRIAELEKERAAISAERDEAIRRWQAVSGRISSMAEVVGLAVCGDAAGDGLEAEVAKLQDFQLHHARLHAENIHRMRVEIEKAEKERDALARINVAAVEISVDRAEWQSRAEKAEKEVTDVRARLKAEPDETTIAAAGRAMDCHCAYVDRLTLERDEAVLALTKAQRVGSELWIERDKARSEVAELKDSLMVETLHVSAFEKEVRRLEEVVALQAGNAQTVHEVTGAEIHRLLAAKPGYVKITPALRLLSRSASPNAATDLAAIIAYLIDVSDDEAKAVKP
jgi:hypothetical protein